MTDDRTLDLFAPPEDPVRALMKRAGVEFALGHSTFSLGGSGCVASLVRGMAGWHRLCAVNSGRLDRARGYAEVSA
jgi:hypothetical protein